MFDSWIMSKLNNIREKFENESSNRDLSKDESLLKKALKEGVLSKKEYNKALFQLTEKQNNIMKQGNSNIQTINAEDIMNGDCEGWL